MENVQSAPMKSASQLKIEATISKFEALKKERTLTTNELKLYANAKAKLENRSASKIYREIMELKDLPELLGNSKVPTFKEFAEKLPSKFLFSLWDGLGVIVKFNKASQLSAKVQKQGGQIGKKADAQTTKATKKVAEILESIPA